MKHLHILALGLTGILVGFGCTTAPKKDNQLTIGRALTEAFAPVYDVSLVESGAIDLLYCSASFRHKNERWPKDYAELCEFVKGSNDYLTLGEYERVALRTLPDDRFEICYVRPGHTNEIKLTLSGSAEKK
jgi:hypothetical protein